MPLPEQKYKPDWMRRPTWPMVHEWHGTELGDIVLSRKATLREAWHMFWAWVDGLIVEIDDVEHKD